MTGKRLFTTQVVLLCALMALAAAPLHAANVYWKSGVVGDWSDGANWGSGAKPQPGDNVYLRNGGEAVVTTDEAFKYLYLSAIQDNRSGVLRIAGGSLDTERLYMAQGNNSTASFYIEDGSYAVSANTTIANYIGTSAYIEVSGGVANFNAGASKLAGNGYGEFRVTGGTANVVRFDVGGDTNQLNGVGKIRVDGGVFNGQLVYIGYRATGSLEISGGTTAINDAKLGFYENSLGTLRVVGAEAASITFGDLTVNTNTSGTTQRGEAAFVFELDADGISTVVVNQVLNFGSVGSTLTVLFDDNVAGGVYDLFDAGSILNYDKLTLLQPLTGPRSYDVYTETEGNRQVVRLHLDDVVPSADVIPEPLTVMGLMMGATGLVGYLRRRRST